MTTSERPLLNRRLAEFGTTIFAEMSALAVAHRLDQPRPGLPGHRRPRGDPRGGGRALRDGRGNQYPPGPGVPELRTAIAAHQQRFYGLSYDPDTRGPGHRGRHRGDRGGAARAGGARRRGHRPRAVLRLLRGLHRDGRRHPRARSPCAPPRRASASTSTSCAPRSPRAPGCSCSTPRTTRPARSSPATSSPRSPSSPSSTTCSWSPTRSTSTWSSTAPRHLPLASLPGDARAHGHHLLGRARRSRSPAGRSAGSPRRRSWSTAVRTAKQFLTYVTAGPVPVRRRRGAAPCRTRTSTAFRDGPAAPSATCSATACATAGLRGLPPPGTYFVTTDIRPLGAGRTASPSAAPCPTLRRRRHPQRRLLRPPGGRPHPCPLRVLQADRCSGRGCGPPQEARRPESAPDDHCGEPTRHPLARAAGPFSRSATPPGTALPNRSRPPPSRG